MDATYTISGNTITYYINNVVQTVEAYIVGDVIKDGYVNTVTGFAFGTMEQKPDYGSVLYGLSTDTKPTTPPINSVFVEINTGKTFVANNSNAWVQIPVALATQTLAGAIPATGTPSGKVLSDSLAWITVSGGGGDVTGAVVSVDDQLVLFNSTTGKIIKAASLTGLVKATAGVASAAVGDTDYALPATVALKAPLANPTFTGTVLGITAAMVGLGNVTNESKSTMFASPTFTGTTSGITAAMVGLGSVNNTADSAKPVSTAQQTALDLKANLASPTFTGTVVLPNGTVTLPMMANMATASLIYRKTAGTGVPEVNTLATLKTDLTLVKADVGLGSVENTALSTWAGTSNITTVGTLAAGAIPTTLLTGTITNAQLAGSIAYSKLSLTGAILNADLAGSIAYSKLSLTGAVLNADLAGSITYAKLQTMTTNKLLGSGTGTAVAEITLGTGLSYTGTTLNVSSAPAPDARLIVDATTADVTNSTTTLAKITEIDQTLGAGTYSFTYHVLYQAAALTTGVRFSVNHSGTVTAFVANVRWVDVSATASTAAADQDALLATGSIVGSFAARAKSTTGWGTTLSVDTINANMLMIIEGMMVVTVSGNIELYHGSEVAAASTVKAGTSLTVIKTA